MNWNRMTGRWEKKERRQVPPPRFLPPVATFVDLKLNFEFILTTYLGMFGSDLVFSHRSFWVMLAPQMF